MANQSLVITIGAVLSGNFISQFSRADATVRGLSKTVGVLDKALTSVNTKAKSISTSFAAATRNINAFHRASERSLGVNKAVDNNQRIIKSNLALSRSYQRLIRQRERLAVAPSMRAVTPSAAATAVGGVPPVIIPSRGRGGRAANRMTAFGTASSNLTQLSSRSMLTGGGVLYLAKRALNQPMELDESLQYLKSKLDRPEDRTLDVETQFRQLALSLGRKGSAYKPSQIAEMFVSMALQGMTAPQILEQASAAFDLGVANRVMDLGSVTKDVARVTGPFNLTGNAFREFGDKATAIANRTTADIEDITMAASYAAPEAIKVGITFDQMMAMIGTVAGSGLQGERMGTGIRSFISRVADVRGGKAEKAFAKLGVSVKDEKGGFKDPALIFHEMVVGLEKIKKSKGPEGGEVEAYKILSAIVGLRGMPSASALLDFSEKSGELRPSYKELMEQVLPKSKGGVERQAAEQIDTLRGDIRKDFGELGTALDETYQAMRPTLRLWAKDLRGVLQGVTESVKSDPSAAATKGKATLIGGAVLLVGGAMSFLVATLGTAVYRIYQLGRFVKGFFPKVPAVPGAAGAGAATAGRLRGAIGAGVSGSILLGGALSFSHLAPYLDRKTREFFGSDKQDNEAVAATKKRVIALEMQEAEVNTSRRRGIVSPSTTDAAYEKVKADLAAERIKLQNLQNPIVTNKWWDAQKNLKATGAIDESGSVDQGATERMIAAGILKKNELSTLVDTNPLIDSTNKLKEESVDKLQSILAVLDKKAAWTPPVVTPNQTFNITVNATGVGGMLEQIQGQVMGAVKRGAGAGVPAYNGPYRPSDEAETFIDH